MKFLTRFSCLYCNVAAYKRNTYILSTFITGAIFSVVVKEYIKKELLYVKRQNEEIIVRLKCIEKRIEKEYQNNIEK